ncbi:MAG: hypothetical protein ACK2T7_00355, partial [Anaerolineales bacterium]
MTKHKVYVSLGFHINLYHSWRGDTPDEAGFGTDIRVIRAVIETLDRANAAGLCARGYWDTEAYWSFQEIIPKYAPDLLEGIRRRVASGQDEIVLGPFNNGANHAATEDEFRAAVAWAMENEWGSGLKQLFGKVAPVYRPQEAMFTTGQEAIFKELGVEGIMLYYAGVPFNTISNFIPVLPDDQRYNPLWFRSGENQLPLALLPCIAAGDLIEYVSLENLMRRLHKKQQRGEINSDVLININEDADLETWLPTVKGFPNLGGLEEFIQAVNKYPWAEFALPSEYLSSHPPQSEVLVRQDLADGGYDGNYSWAEKSSSMHLWSLLEQSRLHSYRAESLAARAGLDLDADLWKGMDSSFFQRQIGLSTTHFGMSTPIINEERQNRAYEILGRARDLARNAEKKAARTLQDPSGGALYEFELYPTPLGRGQQATPVQMPVCLPVVLPEGVKGVLVEDRHGKRVAASLTDVEPLSEGCWQAQLRFILDLESGNRFRVLVGSGEGSDAPVLNRMENEHISVVFSEETGIMSFHFKDEAVGGEDFLSPFVTYAGARFDPDGYQFVPLDSEHWEGLQRVRLKTQIPMETASGKFSSEMTYTFTLFDQLPYLFVDVDARFAYTPPTEVIHNMTQKLRRLMDLGWEETAPFALTPTLRSPAHSPLRVWKHNYLGITSHYDLNYGQYNPKNSQLDAFNHQVTAGWVAVSNRQAGLLIGESAHGLTSMAFCPMRQREENGIQRVSMNPFGSYYGNQMDYTHLGGNGNGSVVMKAFSGALQPNGPSFNGERLRFSLMLAPYEGDEPPQDVQADAAAYFYPPGVIVHASPPEVEAITQDDLVDYISAEVQRAALAADTPVMPPDALLANPSAGAVDLVWDAPRNCAVSGYQINWRNDGEAVWQVEEIEPVTRWQLVGLEDGKVIKVRMRTLRGENHSPWTDEVVCMPGAVTDSSVSSMMGRIPPWT